MFATAAFGLPACSRTDSPLPTAASAPDATAASAPTTNPSPPRDRADAASNDSAAERAVDAPDLKAVGILLPGVVNSATEGTLIELVQAIDEVYTAGRIVIEAVPLARATDAVARGTADLGFPALRMNSSADTTMAYRLSTAAFGQVNFVLYTRAGRALTRTAILQAATQGASFPYDIEAPARNWGFPTKRFSNLESALSKVVAGRIDALLWAQEDADLTLRRLRFKDIHRESFGNFDTVFMLPRGPRGDFVDHVLSASIATLHATGRLQALSAKTYRVHDPWQPATAHFER